MKQSINHEIRPKPWCEDCIYIDDLQDGQKAYVDVSDAYEVVGQGWFISCDRYGSPIKRGVHEVLIVRMGDVIHWRNEKMEDGAKYAELTPAYINNSFPVLYKPFTLEEKVDILWAERTNR